MRITLVLMAVVALITPSRADGPLVYQGTNGIGTGKHIVLLAGDHEYRSEEALPALARILVQMFL